MTVCLLLIMLWSAHTSADEELPRHALACIKGGNPSRGTASPNAIAVTALSFSRDSQFLVGSRANGQIVVWDSTKRKTIETTTVDQACWTSRVFFRSPGHTFLATRGRELSSWTIEGDKLTRISGSQIVRDSKFFERADEFRSECLALSISKDDRFAAFGFDVALGKIGGAPSPTLKVLDLRSGEPTKIDDETANRIGSHKVPSVAFAPDCKVLAYAHASGPKSTGGGVFFFSLSDAPSPAALPFRGGIPCTVDFSADGLQVAAGGGDLVAHFLHPEELSQKNNLYVWNYQTQAVIFQQNHPGVVSSISFSPDGRTLVSASNEQVVRIWDISLGKQLAELKGHRSSVRVVAVSPDGKLLASGSTDSSIMVWSMQSILQNGANTP